MHNSHRARVVYGFGLWAGFSSVCFIYWSRIPRWKHLSIRYCPIKKIPLRTHHIHCARSVTRFACTKFDHRLDHFYGVTKIMCTKFDHRSFHFYDVTRITCTKFDHRLFLWCHKNHMKSWCQLLKIPYASRTGSKMVSTEWYGGVRCRGRGQGAEWVKIVWKILPKYLHINFQIWFPKFNFKNPKSVV